MSLLLTMSLALPKQLSIPSSSLGPTVPDLEAETQITAQIGKSKHKEQPRQHSGHPACSQPHKPSPFRSRCSQRSGPVLPKEQIKSSWKTPSGIRPSSSRLPPPGPFPPACNASRPCFTLWMLSHMATARTACNFDATETFCPTPKCWLQSKEVKLIKLKKKKITHKKTNQTKINKKKPTTNLSKFS